MMARHQGNRRRERTAFEECLALGRSLGEPRFIIRRFADGEPLRGVVDREAGY